MIIIGYRSFDVNEDGLIDAQELFVSSVHVYPPTAHLLPTCYPPTRLHDYTPTCL